MGWADCGTDSNGRPIGYAHSATCDQPGCTTQIHRGLAYACGDMHGEESFSCERYFCLPHRQNTLPDESGRSVSVCESCYADAKAWAIDNPADSFDLVMFFEAEEGPDWRDRYRERE